MAIFIVRSYHHDMASASLTAKAELSGASDWNAGCAFEPRDGRARQPVERLVRGHFR